MPKSRPGLQPTVRLCYYRCPFASSRGAQAVEFIAEVGERA